MDLIQTISLFKQFPRSCIIILINETDKKVYISPTKDLAYFISRFNNIYSKSLGSITSFKIEEINVPYESLKFFMKYYYKQYTDKGYSLVNEYNYVTYNIKIKVKWDAVYMFAENTRKEKIKVGEFKDIFEAISFQEQYYNTESNPCMTLVYHIPVKEEVIQKQEYLRYRDFNIIDDPIIEDDTLCIQS